MLVGLFHVAGIKIKRRPKTVFPAAAPLSMGANRRRPGAGQFLAAKNLRRKLAGLIQLMNLLDVV